MTILFITLSYLCEVAIHELIPDFAEKPLIHSFFFFFEILPTILLGYLFSKECLFQRVSVPKHWTVGVIGLIGIFGILYVRQLCGSILGFSMDFFYAPACILCILAIFNACELKYTRRILTALGNESVYMWFFHALFFVPIVRGFFQPLIRISDNIWIVTLWAIILTFSVSWLLHKLIEASD